MECTSKGIIARSRATGPLGGKDTILKKPKLPSCKVTRGILNSEFFYGLITVSRVFFCKIFTVSEFFSEAKFDKF